MLKILALGLPLDASALERYLAAYIEGCRAA